MSPSDKPIEVSSDLLDMKGTRLIGLADKVDSDVKGLTDIKIEAGNFPHADRLETVVGSRVDALTSSTGTLVEMLRHMGQALRDISGKFERAEDFNSADASELDSLVASADTLLPDPDPDPDPDSDLDPDSDPDSDLDLDSDPKPEPAHLKGESDGAAGGGSSGSSPSSNPPSGNLDGWIREAIAILQEDGVPVSEDDIGDIRAIIEKESGGDPSAINLWDDNAARGTPSKGLMQAIDPTFQAYKLEGHDDIWNPVDNIIACVRYIFDRYGGFDGHPGLQAMAAGGGYVGY